MIKKYKAIDLYKLSTRTNNIIYEGLINQKEKIKVKGFVINKQEQKRKIINFFLNEYSYDKDITKKTLNNSYVVGLFKDSGKKEILFLLFGNNKEILEKFNKKITTGKFSKLFDKEDMLENILEKENNKLILNEVRETKRKNKEALENFKLGELYLKERAKKFIENLKATNLTVLDFLRNEGKINLSLHTIEQNLDELDYNELKQILEVLNSIKIPKVNELKGKIIDKLTLKEMVNNSRNKREEILFNAS